MSNDTALSVETPPARGLAARFKGLLLSQRRNLENLSALVFFNFAAAGLFFVTQVKIANVIGREQFGLLAYGIALGMYGQTIVRYGMDRTLVRDLIHYPDRFSELVVASLILRGILLALVAATLLAWKLIWQPADLSWPVIAVIMAYSLKSLDLQPVYDAWHCMARHAVYNMVQRGLYFVLIWAVVLRAPKYVGLGWIALALLATELFYLVLQQRWAHQRVCWAFAGVKWRSTFTYLSRGNLSIWLGSIGVLSFGTLNQMILAHYHGPEELGGYGACWQLVAVPLLLLTQISRMGNPSTAVITRVQCNLRSRQSFLLKYSLVMVVSACPFVVLAVFFPAGTLKSIFSAEYVSASPILQVLGLYLLVYAVARVPSQYVVSAGMGRTFCASILSGGITSIVVSLLIIDQRHGLGAAWALLLGQSVFMVLTLGGVLADLFFRAADVARTADAKHGAV